MPGDSPQAIKGGRGNPGTKGFPGPSGAGGQGPKGKGNLSLFSKFIILQFLEKGCYQRLTPWPKTVNNYRGERVNCWWLVESPHLGLGGGKPKSRFMQMMTLFEIGKMGNA